MSTKKLEELLNQYVDGELSPKDRGRCEMLIEADGNLRQRVYELEELNHQLMASFARIQPSENTDHHLQLINRL